MRDLLGWNLSLGRWAGIQVRVHVFFLLLAVVALHLAWDDPTGELLIDAVASLAILFVSVLAHELGHCIAARRMGGRADQIMLWPLGGLVSINLSHQPQEELVTAAAGPLVNLAICLVTLPALILAGVDIRLLLNPLAAPHATDSMTWVYALQLTAWINWLLVLVNLLPAYPLDGGRVLRSVVWQKKGYRTAVVVVARVAKFTAVATWVVAGLGMGLTMPSSAVAVMSLSSRFEQGRNQSSMQVAESVGNSVVTAVAGGLYTALLLVPPEKLSYSVSLALLTLASVAAIVVSRRIGHIPNELHRPAG